MSINTEVQNLYTFDRWKKKDQEALFSTLEERFIIHPSEEFISSLFAEESRRFHAGYDRTEGEKLWLSNSANREKRAYSHTVSHFLLTYKVTRSFGEPSIIDSKRYLKLVAAFLEKAPNNLFDCEILNPNPFSLKYDYYSIVSLVFTRALSSIEYHFELINKLLIDTEFLDLVYKNPDSTEAAIPFWLCQGIKLLKRGASIDYGYIEGGSPLFVAFAKNTYGSFFCPLLIKHLKVPNRTGVGNVAPIHAVVSNRLSVSVLEHLLLLGADKEARCTDGLFSGTERTVLEIASTIGHHEAVKVLLNHKANPNSYSLQNENLSCFDEERILTPFQAAVLKNDAPTLAEFFSYKANTGGVLLPNLDPREQEIRSNRHNRFMPRGEATLEMRAAAIQIHTPDNRLDHVYNKLGLLAFAEDRSTRDDLGQALLWLFEEAKYCPAGPIWLPIIHVFEKEISTNRTFTITAQTHKAVGGCYNDDTQSDIYVYPNQSSSTYMHILAHEIAHMYCMKHQRSPLAFLEKFKQAMERDELLDFHSTEYNKLPQVLKDLLNNMRHEYDEAQYAAELFPRVCVQFPILYVILNPFCRQEDLFELMQNIMPKTFKLYREIVMGIE